MKWVNGAISLAIQNIYVNLNPAQPSLGHQYSKQKTGHDTWKKRLHVRMLDNNKYTTYFYMDKNTTKKLITKEAHILRKNASLYCIL